MIKIKKRDLFALSRDVGLAEIFFLFGALFTGAGIFAIIILFITWEFSDIYTILRLFVLGLLFLFFSIYEIGIEK